MRRWGTWVFGAGLRPEVRGLLGWLCLGFSGNMEEIAGAGAERL